MSWHAVHKHPEWICGKEQSAVYKPCSTVSVVASDKGVGMETESGLCLLCLPVRAIIASDAALWWMCVQTSFAVVDKITVKSSFSLSSLWSLLSQERFQVKSPPSTYLTKIKSFYQDQGGVTRRVSVKHHLLFIFDASLVFIPVQWCLDCHLYCFFSRRNGSKKPPRSLKIWRFPFAPITLGEHVNFNFPTWCLLIICVMWFIIAFCRGPFINFQIFHLIICHILAHSV